MVVPCPKVFWAEIAGVYGLEVVKQELPWGSAVKPGHIDEIEGHFDGALLTHSESSTGALNGIRALAQAFKSRFPHSLVLADTITSLLMAEVGLGVQPLSVDRASLRARSSGSR